MISVDTADVTIKDSKDITSAATTTTTTTRRRRRRRRTTTTRTRTEKVLIPFANLPSHSAASASSNPLPNDPSVRPDVCSVAPWPCRGASGPPADLECFGVEFGAPAGHCPLRGDFCALKPCDFLGENPRRINQGPKSNEVLDRASHRLDSSAALCCRFCSCPSNHGNFWELPA